MCEGKEHPNRANQDIFRNRLGNIIEVVRAGEELTYYEVLGILLTTTLDLFMETASDGIIDRIKNGLDEP